MRSPAVRRGDRFSQLLIEVETEEKPSQVRKWGARVVCALGAAASLAAVIVNHDRWTNALGSLAFGASVYALTRVGQAESGLSRLRQVSLTLFSTMTFFGISQAWANTGKTAQTIFIESGMGLLGANLAIIGDWLYERGWGSSESHDVASPGENGGTKFSQFTCMSAHYAYFLKIATSVVAGVLAFSLRDSVYKTAATCVAGFFPLQSIGEGMIKGLNRFIQPNEITWIRQVKRMIVTAAVFGISAALIPWFANPVSDERYQELGIVAMLLGLADGIKNEAIMSRWYAFSPERLPELDEIGKVKGGYHSLDVEPEEPPSRFRTLAHKVWKIGVPTIGFSGLIGFGIWQEVVLDRIKDRVAMGAMLGGSLLALAACMRVTLKWDQTKRNFWNDKLMVFLFASPRILGINPLYMYFFATNVLKMDSNATESLSWDKQVINIVGWAANGFAMVREAWVLWSSYEGDLKTKFPTKLVADASTMLRFYLTGVIS